jgi:hypothetical protein
MRCAGVVDMSQRAPQSVAIETSIALGAAIQSYHLMSVFQERPIKPGILIAASPCNVYLHAGSSLCYK